MVYSICSGQKERFAIGGTNAIFYVLNLVVAKQQGEGQNAILYDALKITFRCVDFF